MPDDDDRVVDAVERFERRTCALLVAGLRIVERKIGCNGLVAARPEPPDERRPGRAVVPIAVDEAERRQRPGISRSLACCKAACAGGGPCPPPAAVRL